MLLRKVRVRLEGRQHRLAGPYRDVQEQLLLGMPSTQPEGRFPLHAVRDVARTVTDSSANDVNLLTMAASA